MNKEKLFIKNRQKMIKVSGTLEDAYGCLTVAQFYEARRNLFTALGLDFQSRTAFTKYLRGETTMRIDQVSRCKNVFLNYGIKWNPKIQGNAR